MNYNSISYYSKFIRRQKCGLFHTALTALTVKRLKKTNPNHENPKLDKPSPDKPTPRKNRLKRQTYPDHASAIKYIPSNL